MEGHCKNISLDSKYSTRNGCCGQCVVKDNDVRFHAIEFD